MATVGDATLKTTMQSENERNPEDGATGHPNNTNKSITLNWVIRHVVMCVSSRPAGYVYAVLSLGFVLYSPMFFFVYLSYYYYFSE